jgi:hypothetical protein
MHGKAMDKVSVDSSPTLDVDEALTSKKKWQPNEVTHKRKHIGRKSDAIFYEGLGPMMGSKKLLQKVYLKPSDIDLSTGSLRDIDQSDNTTMRTRANMRYCYFHRDDKEGFIVAKLFVRVMDNVREEIYFCSDCLLESSKTSQHKNSVAVEDCQLDDVFSHQLGFQLIHDLDWASVPTQLMPKNLHHEELSCCQCVAPEPGMQCCTNDSCAAWKSWEECT